MKQSLAVLFALLLGQGPALAQEEAPAEEPAAEEAPVEEAAPAEGDTMAEAPADDDAVTAEEAGEEPAEEPWEGEYSGFVEAYYLPSVEFGSAGGGDAYADGAGGRGQFQFWKFLAVSAEYTTRTFDDDSKLDEQRVGLGAVARNGGGDVAGLFVEMERLDPETGTVIDGYGLHGRMSHPAASWFRFNADLGYKRLEDDAEKYSGFEFSAGGIATFGRFGVFAEWRRSQLDGKDSGTRLHLEEVRTGLRYDWGVETD